MRWNKSLNAENAEVSLRGSETLASIEVSGGALGFAFAMTAEGGCPPHEPCLDEQCCVTFVWLGYQRRVLADVIFINISQAVGTERKVRISERGVPNEGLAKSLVYAACLPGIGLRRLLVA
jgi:hypothetical protein